MLNHTFTSQKKIGAYDYILETGTIAKQANGSVILRCGDTVLLATVTASKEPRPGVDFFPLTIEYVEKMYASGKIPGGFVKREAKPRTGATLAARLIDRPLRPCFPEHYQNDVQVVVTVLSFDQNFSPEFLGITAASAALTISDIPFNGPVGSALVGLKNGELIFNPSTEQLKDIDLEIVVAGSKDAILMVEAGANEVSEEDIIRAIQFGHEKIKELITVQEELSKQFQKEKKATPEGPNSPELEAKISALIGNRIEENLQSGNKQEIETFLSALQAEVNETLVNEEEGNASLVASLYGKVKKDKIRKTIIQKKIRPDGRAVDEIRPIEIEVGLLPSTHGSALFTRGETQSLGVVTLGTANDEQMEDGLRDKSNSNYYFHYNFPPYSVGEVGNMARTSRRELGHGALAERALLGILPSKDVFPYTMRLVSEIMESNGSSSMASVCSGCLALMDCGVPIKAPVSGIAMGLLLENGEYTILSDIQGLEDHYGDMDFKVSGTEKGITALQLDIKVSGLSEEILTASLNQAKAGRLHILKKMNEIINTPRTELSANAPQIETITINPEKIGIVIGPGGKMIRKIEEESKANIIISDDTPGQILVSASNKANRDIALNMIRGLTKEIERGEVYDGKVVRITNFGAFIELLPGKDGLLHISNISKERVENVEDVLTLGDIIKVKVSEIDKQNRVNLISAALEK